MISQILPTLFIKHDEFEGSPVDGIERELILIIMEIQMEFLLLLARHSLKHFTEPPLIIHTPLGLNSTSECLLIHDLILSHKV